MAQTSSSCQGLLFLSSGSPSSSRIRPTSPRSPAVHKPKSNSHSHKRGQLVAVKGLYSFRKTFDVLRPSRFRETSECGSARQPWLWAKMTTDLHRLVVL